jgi:hypothetical protein
MGRVRRFRAGFRMRPGSGERYLADRPPRLGSTWHHSALGRSNGATVGNTEGSLRGSFVAILTPIFALAAGWVAGLVAEIIPGVDLDRGQIVAFMIAATTAVLGVGWKWLQGWQQHEQLVATTEAKPIRKAARPKA